MEQWMSVNKLKMNIEKWKLMILRDVRKEQRAIVILGCSDGSLIEKVDTIKYLGIIIDDRFKHHCNLRIITIIYSKNSKQISFK